MIRENKEPDDNEIIIQDLFDRMIDERLEMADNDACLARILGPYPPGDDSDDNRECMAIALTFSIMSIDSECLSFIRDFSKRAGNLTGCRIEIAAFSDPQNFTDGEPDPDE